MGGANTHSANEPEGPHFSAYNTAKINDKSTNLRKNGIYVISDVVTASVYSEKEVDDDNDYE